MEWELIIEIKKYRNMKIIIFLAHMSLRPAVSILFISNNPSVCLCTKEKEIVLRLVSRWC